MGRPLVSVIIGVYNGERFLPATLDSLFAQDYTNWEAIAVIDGSTDGSASILAARRRITVIELPQNQGAAAAMSVALASAEGEYVAFLDQDDLWTPDKLRTHVARMEAEPQLDLTFSWFSVIDEEGREMGIHSAQTIERPSFRNLVTDFVVGGTSNIVARRDAMTRIGGIDTDLPRLYDLDVVARVALLAPRNIEPIPRELTRYRRHPHQITRDVTALEAEWFRAIAKLRKLAPEEVNAVEAVAQSNMKRYFARLAYESEEYTKAMRYLRQGFQSSPGNFLHDPRNWITLAASFCGLILPSSALRLLERQAGVRRR